MTKHKNLQEPKEPKLNLNSFKKIVSILMLMTLVFGAYNLFNRPTPIASVTYTQFMNDVKGGKLLKVEIQAGDVGTSQLNVTPKQGTRYQLMAPFDNAMVSELLKNNIQVVGMPPKEPNTFLYILSVFGPTVLIIFLLFYFMKKQGGGGSGAFSFGKSKAKLIDTTTNPITFKDVAGCDEAKEEVSEVVDFLREPVRFQNVGGKIPRGILLIGPPGTGKTLLAKAIAGEAEVPFFSISGSDFVEMFVGVGAARVRDMFEQAKKQAPCIIFVDEIDAVGRHRGGGYGGGNDEREQTLNQMLVEMDGFEPNSGVIVIAATNRVDVLDKALLRPGRFDRQVYVSLPDIKGREDILAVHLKKVPLADDIEIKVLARGTPGFSGADLANLVNEAALFAAKRRQNQVRMIDFEDAKDKLFMGPERRSAVMRVEEKRATAYHESGHAVVAALIPNADPVHKVTIMPRGWALGVTWQLPEHDKRSKYYDDMMTELAILFGGRAAEEVFLKVRSTGASNDFARATDIARDIVAKYGMTDELGPMVYIDTSNKDWQNKTVSESTQTKVDEHIRRLIDKQYAFAMSLLEANKHLVEAMVKALMEWETIDAEQVKEIMAGKEPTPPKYLLDNKSSEPNTTLELKVDNTQLV